MHKAYHEEDKLENESLNVQELKRPEGVNHLEGVTQNSNHPAFKVDDYLTFKQEGEEMI